MMRRVAVLFVLLALVAPAARAASRAEVDSVLAAASVAAHADRHGDAIALYERLLTDAPWRVNQVSAPLAWQYAWAGRLDDARREFDRAIALAPDDFELRMGRLLTLNWMGRHLTAWRGYEWLHESDVTRPGPLVGLAAAQRWAGRNDLARRSVDLALTLDPGSRDAQRLAAALHADLRPEAGIYHDYAEDSDGYRVGGVWGEASFAPHPQARVVAFANKLTIRRAGTADLDELWAGLRVVARPWTRVGLRAEGRWLTNRETGAAYTPLTGTAAVTVTASDGVRIGVNAERFAVVSYVTRPEKITGEVVGGWTEFQPDWKTRVRLAADHATYSDDNARWSAVVSGSRHLGTPARLRFGLVARWIDFDRWLDDGIWTPDSFRSGAATLEFELGDRERWSLAGGAELGPAQEQGGDPVLNAAWNLRFARALGRFALEASAGHSEGNLETGTGYDRTWTHLGVRGRF